MIIQTVKIQEEGYLVNGNMHVPDDAGNRHCKEVLKWIAEGNTPQPELTADELLSKTEKAKKTLAGRESILLRNEALDMVLDWAETAVPMPALLKAKIAAFKAKKAESE